MAKRNQRQANRTGDYHSAFEREVADALAHQRLRFDYELHSFKWKEKLPSGYCPACGHKPVIADRIYTPDFWVWRPDGTLGFIIEVKGIFTIKDRKIAEAMSEMYEGEDFRYLFYYDNKLSRSSKTRYSAWCKKRDMTYGMRSNLDGTVGQWAKELV